MRAPSAKTIAAGLGVPLPVAERVRRALKHEGSTTRQALEIAGVELAPYVTTFGVLTTLPGKGPRSPSIEFLSRGETYATTVLYLGGVDCQGNPTGEGRWAIGSWGDIVEKGAYA